MHNKGYYIDDYVSVTPPSNTTDTFHCLRQLMDESGLTVGQKKLVPPSMKVVCLGILMDSDAGTILIPSEKLMQLQEAVKEWQKKEVCTKQHFSRYWNFYYMCINVCSARTFLNRMVDILHASQACQRIKLTPELKHDLV